MLLAVYTTSIKKPTGKRFYSCFNLCSNGILSDSTHIRNTRPFQPVFLFLVWGFPWHWRSLLGWWRSIYNSSRIQHTAHAQKSSCWNCVRRNYWCGQRTRNRNTSWKGLIGISLISWRSPQKLLSRCTPTWRLFSVFLRNLEGDNITWKCSILVAHNSIKWST